MGTSTSAAQLAGKLNRAGAALTSETTTSVAEAALAGKGIFLANLPARRMRNVGRSGARLGARYDLKPGTTAGAFLYYTGPVHLLNNPTSAHRIEPRGRTRTKSGRARSGAKAILPGGDPRAYANHPGTSGRNFFPKAVQETKQAAKRIVSDGVGKAIRKAF